MIRAPDRQLLNVLAGYDRPVAGLVLALREIVLEEAPDAVERMYSNHPSAVWFGGRTENEGHVLLYRGGQKPRESRVLPWRIALRPEPGAEGEGKTMRHIKFRNDSDVERSFVRRYIRSAMG